MYPVFTTFVLIITVLASIVFLLYVNNKLLEFKNEKSTDLRERGEFRNIRDRLLFCYGNVVDERVLVANLDCLRFQSDQGASIKKHAFGECPADQVKELNFRGYGKIEKYDIPIYGPDHSLICPAELTVYEHAVNVPLILKVLIQPQIAVQGTRFDVLIEFFHSKFPSYIDMAVLNLSGTEFLKLSSGPLNANQNKTTFQVDSAGLRPGLYTTTTIATNDREFYDRNERAGLFRVVDPADAPIIHSVRVSPPNGTIYDLFRITVNVSDYVNLSFVSATISQQGRPITQVNLTHFTYVMDWEWLVQHFQKSGIWDPSDMPNENSTYEVSITATNILGNSAVSERSADQHHPVLHAEGTSSS